jgi:hypothetical protein
MGPLEGLDALFQSEIKVIKSIIEGQFKNMAGIFGSLGSKASHISESVGFSFRMAKQQYLKDYNKLDSKTQDGLNKVLLLDKKECSRLI